MANTLGPGEVRVGWFIDENSPGESPVVLRNENGRITLTVPYSYDNPQVEAKRRWFTGQGVAYSDDPRREKYRYEPPRSLLFNDSNGPVALFDCRNIGYREALGNAGEGRLAAGFAVLGGRDLSLDKPLRIRTFIPGMSTWAGQTSIKQTYLLGDGGRGKGYKVETIETDDIEIGEGIVLRSSWEARSNRSTNSVVLESQSFLETEASGTEDFWQQYRKHAVLLELFDLAYWKPSGYSKIEVKPRVSENVSSPANRWLEVKTDRLRRQVGQHEGNPFFLFSEIGADGYKKWVEIREKMGRAIAPMMSLVENENRLLESCFIQSCIALEGIGVQLDRDAGDLKKKKSLECRLNTVQDSVGIHFSDGWAKRTANTYNNIKHYDRDFVDPAEDIYSSLQENVLTFRAWAAMSLGFDKEVVKERLPSTSEGRQLIGLPHINFKTDFSS